MSIKKDTRDEEEIAKDRRLLEAKPEIDRKLAFYKGTMLAIEKMFNSIEERIKRGYITETSTFLGIFKVKTKKFLDEYDLGKLEVEKYELEAEVFAKTSFYEQWLKRSKDYEVRFEEITLECNEHFDETLLKAKDIALNFAQIRLGQTIERYEKEDKHDQKTKNEFYLYLRKEVTNHFNNKTKRAVLAKA
jgi:hypothetical protein